MVYEGIVKGEYVSLISVTEEDAEFTLSVRQNERLTRYLPKVTNTIEQQRKWISNQRLKDGDYYFVAWSNDKKPVGTIGIYDIKNKIGEGGRLTSIGNALQSLEIQYLILKFDFNILKLDKVTAYVYADNLSALKLSKKLGLVFEEPSKDTEGRLVCNGSITREQFESASSSIERMLYRH